MRVFTVVLRRARRKSVGKLPAPNGISLALNDNSFEMNI